MLESLTLTHMHSEGYCCVCVCMCVCVCVLVCVCVCVWEGRLMLPMGTDSYHVCHHITVWVYTHGYEYG